MRLEIITPRVGTKMKKKRSTTDARQIAPSCLYAAILCAMLGQPVAAISFYEVKDAAGTPFIGLRFFDQDDGIFGGDEWQAWQSTWNLGNLHKTQSIAATQYWSEIIKTIPGKNPAIINVGTFDQVSAAALSWSATSLIGSPTTVQAALTNQDYDKLDYGSHGVILIGKMDWAPEPYIPSHISLVAGTSLSTVMIHEIGHALGIMSNAFEWTNGDGQIEAGFVGDFGAWSTHLRDDNDNAAKPGQYILCSTCVAPEGSDVFDVRRDQAYFAGTHVAEVMQGGMKGLPMRIATDYGPRDAPFFSHIELKNSLMSHQFYRNYTTLMEAEMAALQDIGYSIDRRNFYGNSVYGDGLTLRNSHPYFARNADGTAYLANTYNTATLGLGLHIYGSHNTVSQDANLLSVGVGGGGIRVDGANNHLIVSPGVQVHADGVNGRGIMFAYGKDHILTQRGDVQALGENGYAVSFDFGHNARGDASGVRGSYFATNELGQSVNLPELQGALVSRFDLTGRVAGSKAAIFMSDNALVDQINVMQGASISGDIVSDYLHTDDNGDLRLTTLSFGLKANAEGNASSAADADFSLAYQGNIKGGNIALHLKGGTSLLTGQHHVFNVNVAPSARLMGSGLYQVNAGLTNSGTVFASSIGDAITINGDYRQTATGVLQLAFNNKQDISSLVVNGTADLDGTLSFTPSRAYYQDAFTFSSDQWLQAAATNGGFTDIVSSVQSPTLTSSVIDQGQNRYAVALTRTGSAYSQYAQSQNAQHVGLALDGAAANASAGLQELITALDFSASNGSDVRVALPQLSGEVYASTMGVLTQASADTRFAVNNRLQQTFGFTSSTARSNQTAEPNLQATLPANSAWGTAFGSWSRQSGDANAARITSTLGGFTLGADTAVQDNWRLGVLAGYSHSTVKVRERSASGASDNYTLGAYAGKEWAGSSGVLGLRTGVAYSWHNAEMNRTVSFADFNDALTADYKANTAQVFGELAYQVALSPRTVIEPYANLAYVHLRTKGFDEQGAKGAALRVHSSSVDSTLSTLGMRVATGFTLGELPSTLRTDLAWRHAYGKVVPAVTASLAAGSNTFTALGNSMPRDTALIETGFDIHLKKNALVGLTYQGQFGSGFSQNSVNANLKVRF